MQLFLIERPATTDTMLVTDSALVHQMGRVLRMRKGDECFLQWEEGEQVVRGLATINGISKKEIEVSIDKNTEYRVQSTDIFIMAIALPNKWSKAELIVQKLTEIGVDRIIWFVAERSQYQTIPDKKMQRMQEISKESTEQSWGWSRTEVKFVASLEEVMRSGGEMGICDIKENAEEETIEEVDGSEGVGNEEKKKRNAVTTKDNPNDLENRKIIFIGPEGGRGPKDYVVFDQYAYVVVDLGERVLRMETAAIVAGWKMKNK